jgi:hypothetical protein
MKKLLTLLTLLYSSINLMAQAYEFETKEGSSNGIKTVTCTTKDYAKLDAYSPDVVLDLFDMCDSKKVPVLMFRLFKLAEQHKESFPAVDKMRRIALDLPKTEDSYEKKDASINLFLSNGDVLRGSNSSMVILSTVQRNLMVVLDSVGVIEIYSSIGIFESSNNPKERLTFENQQVICQQLRTYDIVKIEIDGTLFYTPGLRSAATFDAMFNVLAQKTGKGDQYKYTGSSSYSETTASATGNLGHMVILSDGDLLCNVENLNIQGAKGREVTVLLTLENIRTGEDALVLEKIVTPKYDDSTYSVIHIKRNVQDEYAWDFPKYGGTFKVHAQIYMDSGRRDSKGRAELDLIGEFGNKRITIFKKSNGSWGSHL